MQEMGRGEAVWEGKWSKRDRFISAVCPLQAWKKVSRRSACRGPHCTNVNDIFPEPQWQFFRRDSSTRKVSGLCFLTADNKVLFSCWASPGLTEPPQLCRTGLSTCVTQEMFLTCCRWHVFRATAILPRDSHRKGNAGESRQPLVLYTVECWRRATAQKELLFWGFPLDAWAYKWSD